MQQTERFMVSTTVYDAETDSFVHKNTIADSRPMAIRHAERIGEIDAEDRPRIVDFLEGRDGNLIRSLRQTTVMRTGPNSHDYATIFWID